MKFEWKQIAHKYGPDSNYLYVSGYKFGSVTYRILSKSDSEDERYSADVFLPGLKENQGHFPNIESAKERIEKAVNCWFEKVKGD